MSAQRTKKLKIPKAHWSVREVSFVRPADVIHHADERRTLNGIVADFSFPFPIEQIKLIEFSAESVETGLSVGNHHHFRDSGQWEIVIVLGNRNETLFRFRYRNQGGPVKEKKLKGGDVVIVPPGCTLALLAVAPGARILEISNMNYHQNYVKDRLFQTK